MLRREHYSLDDLNPFTFIIIDYIGYNNLY